MKGAEKDEPSFGLTHLTGCDFDLLWEAPEPVDAVGGMSSAIREQMSAAGESPPPPYRLN